MRTARLRFTIAALVAVVAGMLILIVGESISSTAFEWLRSLLLSVGALLLASVALGVLWEFWGRASFLDDVMDRVGMAHNLERAGIQNVTNQYLRDVAWSGLISSAKHVDLLFAYARTWRNAHRDELIEMVNRRETRTRIVLPDIEDMATIGDLARRYTYEPDELRELIEEAVTFFSEAHDRSSGSDLRIFMHPSPQVYSYYRFDDHGVVAMYRQASGRGQVPVIEFERGGTLYQMLKDDFEDVADEARLIYPLTDG